MVRIPELWGRVQELEATLIPHGLHVLGQPPSREERADLLGIVAEAQGAPMEREALLDLADGGAGEGVVAETARQLGEDTEIPALIHALDGGYTRPVAAAI